MDFKKLREIQRLIKLTKALKEFKKIMLVVDENRKQAELKKWYQSHQEIIESLSISEVEAYSEKSDYDKDEWLKIVAQLKRDLG